MKVFVLLSRVPWPLEKGDKLRAYHQLRELSRHHEVFLCCLADRAADPDAIAHLRTIAARVEIIRLNRILIGWRMLLALFSAKPFQVHYFLQLKARSRVHRLIREFSPDHLFCQLIRCSEYVKNLHEFRKTLDYMDALNAGLRRRIDFAPFYLRPFIREEMKRTVAYENLVFDYFDAHTIISEQDRQLIFHPERERIIVVPNGVDVQFFQPGNGQDTRYDLVFTGNMSYPPNVECALRIIHSLFPLLAARRPSLRVLIAGANPDTALARANVEGITVTGWMPDIREAYRQAKVFLAPMRLGSGMQNKLLEAMSMGLPCLTSALAANGLPDGLRGIPLVGESDDDFVRLALELLENTELRAARGREGREAVSAHSSWERATAPLIQLIAQHQMA